MKIRLGREHPLADPNGYAYEHLVVLAAAGITLNPNEVTHHENEDRRDNRLENLVVVSNAEHNRLHPQPHGIDGRFIPVAGPRPTSGGRLLDGREWNATPQEVRA